MLLALLIALASAPGAADIQVAPSVTEKPVASNALELARLLGPDAATAALAGRAFEQGLYRDFASDPDQAAFEQRHPGFTKAIVTAAGIAFGDHYRAMMPARQVRYARFFQTRFTSDEIDALVPFYSGPTGRKIIAELLRTAEASRAGGAGIEQMSRDVERASPAFDAGDVATLAKMANSTAYAKMAAAMPAYDQLTREIMAEPDPALKPVLRKAIMAATEAFGDAEQKAPAR